MTCGFQGCDREPRWRVWYGRAVPKPYVYPMYAYRCDEHCLLPNEHWPVYRIVNISLSRLVAIQRGKDKHKERMET